jgi:hypothetical protein
MNLEKVIFGFFIILAMTLNFSFVYGEVGDPTHHNMIEFFVVLVVNLIATTLKLGDRSQIGALLLATSLVADLQLIAAALIWTFSVHIMDGGTTHGAFTLIVSLSAGALLSNVVSVIVVVTETLMLRR